MSMASSQGMTTSEGEERETSITRSVFLETVDTKSVIDGCHNWSFSGNNNNDEILKNLAYLQQLGKMDKADTEIVVDEVKDSETSEIDQERMHWYKMKLCNRDSDSKDRNETYFKSACKPQ